MNNLDSWKLALYCWLELISYYFKKYIARDVSPIDEFMHAYIKLAAQTNYTLVGIDELDHSEVNFWANIISSFVLKPAEIGIDEAVGSFRQDLLKEYFKTSYPEPVNDHFGDVDYWFARMQGDDYNIGNLISKGIYHSKVARFRVMERQNTYYLRAPVEALRAQQEKADEV